MQMVAEGYPASKSINELNKIYEAPMPIASAIYEILWEGRSPISAFHQIEKILI